MNKITVKIGKDGVSISKKVFLDLLSKDPITNLSVFKEALSSNVIKFKDLKDLASRSDIPYPLFFAPEQKVGIQLKRYKKIILSKLPAKSEASLSTRGEVKLTEIELLVKDLSAKQEFLKQKVLPGKPIDRFTGSLAGGKLTNKQIAHAVRTYFELNLQELRSKRKDEIIAYICEKIEAKNIFVSFSSYQFMPQEIDKKIRMSGLCIKDKKFPFIFINTRDGERAPLILEIEGRQLFTIISMLVCIGMNKFVLSTSKAGQNKLSRRIYAITGEILIPTNEIIAVEDIFDLEQVKRLARLFKVTPSMFLFRLLEIGKISREEFSQFSQRLNEELKDKDTGPRNRVSEVKGYKKYNGDRFSREVIKAYQDGRVTEDMASHVLFRKRKASTQLFQDYIDIL